MDRKISAGIGFIMLLMMAGFEDGPILGYISWLGASVALLWYGKAFENVER